MTDRVLYEFGPFTLDPLKRVLMRQGQTVPVPPRAVDVLLALLAQRGAVASKDELLRRVWNDTVVEENNLSVSISALRKALGETIREHRYIVTVPRRGYSFVASVNERPSEPSNAAQQDSEPLRPQNHVLVAPFVVSPPRAPDAAIDYLREALADGVTARLGNNRHVTVARLAIDAAHTKESALLALARRGHADHVLLANVRLDGKRARVTARLSRTADASTAWGVSFEDVCDDLFAAEGRIADRLAHAVAAHFEEELHQRSARRTAESAEAHRDYVRGRYFWNKRTEEGLRKAIEHFERAIHADPGYALPYSGLADCFLLLTTYGAIAPRQGVPKAVRAATRALEIDDTLAEAYTSLGYARFAYYWRWAEAETYFRRAIELNPNYATGHHLYADHLAATGRFDAAVESLQTALALEPWSLIVNTDLGWVLFHARRWAQGIEHLEKTVEMDGSFVAARWVLGLTLLQAGDERRAISELQTASRLAPDSPHVLGSLAQALGVGAERVARQAVVRELRELGRRKYVSPYHRAVAHLGSGNRDAAVRDLREAVAERAHWVAYFHVTPTLDALRGHPGFVRILNQIAAMKG